MNVEYSCCYRRKNRLNHQLTYCVYVLRNVLREHFNDATINTSYFITTIFKAFPTGKWWGKAAKPTWYHKSEWYIYKWIVCCFCWCCCCFCCYMDMWESFVFNHISRMKQKKEPKQKQCVTIVSQIRQSVWMWTMLCMTKIRRNIFKTKSKCIKNFTRIPSYSRSESIYGTNRRRRSEKIKTATTIISAKLTYL